MIPVGENIGKGNLVSVIVPIDFVSLSLIVVSRFKEIT